MTRQDMVDIMQGLKEEIEAALEAVFDEVISAREQRDEAEGEVERLSKTVADQRAEIDRLTEIARDYRN